MSPEKLVRMANQIATFFSSQPREDQVERVAGHLRDFWAPSMRARLAEIAKSDKTGLDPLVLAATARLAERRES